MVNIYYFIDIVLNFNTGYILLGKYIEDRKKIAKNYFKMWFWIDISSTLPYE